MAAPFDRVAWAYDLVVGSKWFFDPEPIRQALQLTGEEVIADLGGGTGLYASALAPYAREVTVIDESAKMLSRVPSMENVSTLRADIRSIPIADSRFDAATMIDVVHHVRSAERAVAEAHRVLKPSGRLLVMDFDARSIRTKLLWPFEMLLFGYVQYRTMDAMMDLLGETGFVDVRCEDCGWNYIVTGNKR